MDVFSYEMARCKWGLGKFTVYDRILQRFVGIKNWEGAVHNGSPSCFCRLNHSDSILVIRQKITGAVSKF